MTRPSFDAWLSMTVSFWSVVSCFSARFGVPTPSNGFVWNCGVVGKRRRRFEGKVPNDVLPALIKIGTRAGQPLRSCDALSSTTLAYWQRLQDPAGEAPRAR